MRSTSEICTEKLVSSPSTEKRNVIRPSSAAPWVAGLDFNRLNRRAHVADLRAERNSNRREGPPNGVQYVGRRLVHRR